MDQDNAPFVTVLMPVYNGEKFLSEAIDSILSQTFADFEFLIINDGSTDRTEEIIRSYSDHRIRYVKNDQNIKLIATLNKGLSLARGKYIARMDADDISLPDRLNDQVRYMEEHPEIVVCGTDINILGNIANWVRKGDPEFVRFCMAFHNSLCHPTVMMRTAILREHSLVYPAEAVHAEEYELWRRILSFGQIAVLDRPLLTYRHHDAQVSSLYKEQQMQMINRIRYDFLKEIVLCCPLSVKNAHFRIVSLLTQGLNRKPFGDLKFDFYDEVGLGVLIRWLIIVRISIIFKRSWNTVYMRALIRKVAVGVWRKFKRNLF